MSRPEMPEYSEDTFLEYLKEREKELEQNRKNRPAMMTKTVPKYDYDSSKYPDRIRVSFEDGHTAVYDLHIEQPAPIIIENIEIIRKWNVGYKAPEMAEIPERRRRRR